MQSKFSEMLSSLTKEELREMGVAFFNQPLARLFHALEGANAARDSEMRGEVFRGLYADHVFSLLVEEVGSQVTASVTPVELIPGASVIPIWKARAVRQLQAEKSSEEQMR